eukprot:TRINITY_DN7134_c0_g1_i2.p1 TRINITY_DN7134_c0_g1~~TRINITY_DN7134_c0_g1_i2.p1  ORF type:complete len:271 (+),score=76.13 TRINITY_DN7134_c0_g1_i2:219-1031(+)
MFAFHKPKVFRSINGCCICRAKSSSSRFTDSKKYESVFQTCFNLEEKRFGEICNACVLLVKRYLKLPSGSTRHWNHVVDARSGPGIKSLSKARAARLRQSTKEAPLKQSPIKPPQGLISKATVSSSRRRGLDVRRIKHRPLEITENVTSVSDFLDMSIWKRQIVCCGTIFRGPYGEVVIDPRFLNPCGSCKKTNEDGSNGPLVKDKSKKNPSSSDEEEDVIESDGSADELSSGSGGCEVRGGLEDDEGFFDKPLNSSSSPRPFHKAVAAA